MKLKNSKAWKQNGINSAAICFLGFLLAFCLRYMLDPLLDDHLSMLFFSINCIVMAYFFGFWHSMWLFLISLFTAFYCFRKPVYSYDGINREDIYPIIVYGSIILLVSWIIESLQRERYTATLLKRTSDTRYQLLIESDQARRMEQEKNAAEKNN
jgi:K+-sensing histidine kinase KdpD